MNYERYMKLEGAAVELVLEREFIEPGRSFSSEALDKLQEDIEAWIGSRIMRRWDGTGEPPTRLVVRLHVEAS